MDPAIAIVPMGLGHLRQVLDLGYEVFDTTLEPYTSWSLTSVAEHLDSPDNACWVALDSDRVVGFVLGSMEFEHRGVSDVVRPAESEGARTGFGRRGVARGAAGRQAGAHPPRPTGR
ncbi:hypothetical protein OG874_18905 [Nocardia sp. NBC_00565]|uniref:hypothetical protein n=1 Tax=Nocardia sp. NBC_00565 TaxID=2975993 RepID=UPI002E7FC5F0|nr:hypothetical protein [Nocardia sp. NBC_00565]WUC07040.1 hypothetical protein OG874_18905 [Nocardia sp. NBC_00565]